MSLGALPQSLTSFVGREQEVIAVRDLLQTTRLLTLTGSGGSGKTRLASKAVEGSGALVSWVGLAPIRQVEHLPAVVLAAVGVEQGNRSATAALVDALRNQAALLVLDNCEHLVEGCAQLVDLLLRSCSRLRVLATSREALGVAGERAWLVPGMSLPGIEGNYQAIAASEAVRLFIHRAQSAQPGFTLDREKAGTVAAICKRLDGLPLAIELAAARVRSVPLEEMLNRLQANTAVLGAARAGESRHRTLRATITWSYDLLDPPQRLMLERVSVFAGDFAIGSAEFVCAGGEIAADEVLDCIGALVDKSLVSMREVDGVARYYMLETIRQHARDLLIQSGEADAVKQRHADAFTALLREAEPHFITRDRPAWARCVQGELDNVRVALAWARDHAPERFVELAGLLGWFWYSSGLWAEGRQWLENAIGSSTGQPDSDSNRVRVLLGAGVLASLQADAVAAIGWLDECVELAGRIGDGSRKAYARAYIGIAYGQSGDPRALAPLESARDWFEASGDRYGLRLTLVVLATYQMIRGSVQEARSIADRAVQIARESGLDRELAIALQVLATIEFSQGDLESARVHFRGSLAALTRDPSVFWAARALQLLGLVTCRLGDELEGARLLGAAERGREVVGAELLPHDRQRLEPVVAEARARVGKGDFAAAWGEGRAMTLEDALAYALGTGDNGSGGNEARAESVAGTLVNAPRRPILIVRSLGRLEIECEGRRLEGETWSHQKPKELLLYLLSHPEGRSREQIGSVFWPEASAAQVKNIFHVTLHHLRKALGRSDLIVFAADRYRMAWELGIWFDAALFEESLASEGLKQQAVRRTTFGALDVHLSEAEGLALYRADFLVNERMGAWHAEIKDGLRGLFVDAMLRKARALAGVSDGCELVEVLQRVFEVDPLNQEAAERLVAELDRQGLAAEARAYLERFEAVWRQELGTEPPAREVAPSQRASGSGDKAGQESPKLL